MPTPTVKPVTSSASLAELERRVAGAVGGDDTAGETAKKSSYGASTTDAAGDSTVSPMVIGGTTTSITSAPWMAQLWYYDDQGTADEADDLGFFCGGAVVAPTKI
ncbi:serine protease, partial [Streptomyces sp. NPDC006356]